MKLSLGFMLNFSKLQNCDTKLMETLKFYNNLENES